MKGIILRIKQYTGTFQALNAIRIILCLCLLLQCLLSKKLWMGQERSFPVIPLFEGLAPIADIASFIFSLALLLLTVLVFRRSISLFALLVLIFTFLVMLDLDRLQPWLFQILFLTLVASWRDMEKAKVGILFILVFTYIISGLQKLNPFFGKEVLPSLLEMAGFQLKEGSLLSSFLTYFIPVIEILAGIGLLLRFSRSLSLLLIACIHIVILFITRDNGIIIPWNICLALIAIILFIRPIHGSIYAQLRLRSAAISLYVILLFFAILPLLGLFGYWPNTLSAAMYSGLKPECVYYSKDADLNKVVPDWLKDIMIHNESQGIYFVDMDAWALKELNVPTVGGELLLKAIAKKVCRKAKTDHKGGLYFTTKSRWKYGPITKNCSCDSLLMSK